MGFDQAGRPKGIVERGFVLDGRHATQVAV